MTDARHRSVSLVEAARVIYGTSAPSEQQLRRVYERMKSGTLGVLQYGRTPLQWTTSEQALADYVAAELLKRPKRTAPPGAVKPQPLAAARGTTSAQRREAGQMRAMYRDIVRDYVLAVILRRRTAQRSRRFRHAVLVGQVALLLGLFMALFAAARLVTSPLVPQHEAIERWIAERTERHHVTRWYPLQPSPDGQGHLVEVEYRYLGDSTRMVHTRRTFRVQGDDVTEVAD